MKLKKELGQNFLKDSGVISGLIKDLEVMPNDQILEIGSGLGGITAELMACLPPSAALTAVEYDQRFIAPLKNLAAARENVSIIHANVLDLLSQQPAQYTKIIGAIPYNITSPILHKIIYLENQPEKVVLLIQKEVAQKIALEAPHNNYLASFTQAFFEVSLAEVVPNTAFEPAPKVESQVLVLNKKPAQTITHNQKHRLEGFLHKAYSNPRKMLNKVFSEEELEKTGINPQSRPQEISVEKWVKVFKELELSK